MQIGEIMGKVLIIGGGAAGMFASIFASLAGHEVHVFERNEKLGKKLFITGKGRCNITNACDMEELFDSVMSNSKFLYSSFYGLTNGDVIDFFRSIGVKTKVERGNRVFPMSDRSSDVIHAMEQKMKEVGVQVHLKTYVKSLITKDNQICGVSLWDGRKVAGDAVFVATGGYSYQSTGSTGDGYTFAERCGHTVTKLLPSLVPLEVKESYITCLQGLSLRNVTLTIQNEKKKLFEEFGELMFTHFGITGPLVLTASAKLGKKLIEGELRGTIDLKPALSMEQLDARLLREFEAGKNKQFKNVVDGLFPAKLLPVMIEQSGICPDKRINEISREERQSFAALIKNFPFTITKTRDFNEAIITKGGIRVREIDPGTMESKLVKGLYFIGEVLDLDALTGGFNLQIAWSTAYAAAISV